MNSTCFYHNIDGHELAKCFKFCHLPYEERRQFAVRNHLCCSCLGAHMYASCLFGPVPDRPSVRSVVGSIAMPCTRNRMMGTIGVLNETRPPPVLIVSRFAGLAAMFLNVAQKFCPSRFGCRVHHGSCIAILSWMSRAMRLFAILVSVTSSVFPLLQVPTHRLLCPDSNQR